MTHLVLIPNKGELAMQSNWWGPLQSGKNFRDILDHTGFYKNLSLSVWFFDWLEIKLLRAWHGPLYQYTHLLLKQNDLAISLAGSSHCSELKFPRCWWLSWSCLMMMETAWDLPGPGLSVSAKPHQTLSFIVLFQFISGSSEDSADDGEGNNDYYVAGTEMIVMTCQP